MRRDQRGEGGRPFRREHRHVRLGTAEELMQVVQIRGVENSRVARLCESLQGVVEGHLESLVDVGHDAVACEIETVLAEHGDAAPRLALDKICYNLLKLPENLTRIFWFDYGKLSIPIVPISLNRNPVLPIHQGNYQPYIPSGSYLPFKEHRCIEPEHDSGNG